MIDFKLIGQRIRQQRNLLHLTQEQFSEQLGISIEHLSRIENGTQRPSLLLLERICQLFQTEISYLMFGIKSKESIDYQLLNEIESLSEEKKRAILTIINYMS